MKCVKAFSLVEVLIGLLVLAIALLALAAVPPMATKLFVSGADHEKAMSLALEKLEELEGRSFDGSSISSTSSTDSYGGTQFSWNLTVNPDNPDSGDDFTDVSITVTWDAVVGNPRVVVERRLSRFGSSTAE